MWKDIFSLCMFSGKCKLKQQWDTTTHLLNDQNPKFIWLHQILVQIWSDKKSHSLLMKLRNGTTSSECSWVVSYETEHNLTISSSNHAPWNLPKEVENLCPHKKLHMAALFIIAQTWKWPRCPSVDKWISKLLYIQTISKKYYLALQRNEMPSCENTCILLSEGSQSKNAVYAVWFYLYDILEKARYCSSENSGVCQRLVGRKGWIYETLGIFRAGELLCMIL